MSGASVSREQIERLHHRYLWAGQNCKNKDVLEIGCGNGQGARYLDRIAKRYVASDYSAAILACANNYYQGQILFLRMDAQNIAFADNTFDVVIIFEAIYYIENAQKFVSECKRVLKDGGKLLIATANKDLYDFNPSPYSYEYYGIKELKALLDGYDFDARFYGVSPVADVSIIQKIFRPVKAIASRIGIIPKSMKGKELLKRIIFGKLVRLPDEINEREYQFTPPAELVNGVADTKHKVIYCIAKI